jgi:hypothetical protein
MPDRLIYEGMLRSKRVCSLGFRDRWLYQGLLLTADDCGLFEADAALLRALVYARDLGTVSERDCESGLSNIEQAVLVKFYTVDGKRYGALWNFRQKLKRKRQRFPTPPQQIVDWVRTTEAENGDVAPREPEPNRNQSEEEGKRTHGASLPALAGYAHEHCAFRLGMDGAGKALRAVGAEFDWALVQALEHLASRDARTRWQNIDNPLGLFISLAQSFRDGIGPEPQGEFKPFSEWLAELQARMRKPGVA